MITKYTEICLFCCRPKTDIHHLIYGHANRRLADEDGLVVPLCRECHEFMHKHGKISKTIGQLAYERNKCAEGYSVDAARESFRLRYGKSYL